MSDSSPRRALPAGLVTFLFSDIEGSTRLFRRLGSQYLDVLELHNRLLRHALAEHGGVEVKTEGDAFFVAFAQPAAALDAAVSAQIALRRAQWPPGVQLRVRVGVHQGEAEPVENDYIALAVNQAARVVAAAHGGQVLATAETTRAAGPGPGRVMRALGAFRLRDFDEPVELVQIAPAGGEATEFPAVRAIPAAAHNVAVPRMRLLGRAEELDLVAAALGSSRLVTICGPGGVGKTRLVRELIIARAADWGHGAWMVDLAVAEAADGLWDRLAHALGVGEVEASIADSVIGALERREMLLALDNCEHVLGAAAEVAEQVLDACPQVQLVATSRQRLGVEGEVALTLRPLEAEPARELFAERAVVARAGLELSAEDDPAVARIVRGLDGLPLALELAAARASALTPEEIAARLDDRFALLGRPRAQDRSSGARQQTLRALLDWSYELLEPAEAQTLRRVAAFAGSFSLGAAEELVSGEQLPRAEVAARLASLVDKSLVDRDERGFRLLETVREYGRMRLRESGEHDAARDRYLQWITRAVARRGGEDVPRWLERVGDVEPDLMAGLRWALETGNAAAGLELAAACGRFFSLHGRVDAQPLLEGLLDLAGRPLEDHVAASVLDEVSGLALLQGDASTAEACAQGALAIAQRTGDLEMELDALNSLGGVTLHEGELDQSRAHEQRILELAGRAGLDRHVMKSLVNLGWVELAQGHAADALERFAAALELADQLHDRSGRAYALLGSAEAHLELGEFELAQHALDTAVPLHEADNNVGELLSCIECAAALAARRGESGRARALFAWCRAERERRRLRLQPVYFAPRIAAWEAAVDREPGPRDETLPPEADLAAATRCAIRRSETAPPASRN